MGAPGQADHGTYYDTSGELLTELVERLTFHNPDNGFCLLRVKARDQRDLITVIGHLPRRDEVSRSGLDGWDGEDHVRLHGRPCSGITARLRRRPRR